ncbi:excisionase family DNA binding protein [Microvirga lupini]|uniref:Excisionase family DNA binding protein n=1 Tax=Microvirga lupini TaxID=420324 RepID=A0A7W4YXQ9_9HYPH|nr:helix-turn-helix domain-containing protein [Microvirga lupini]MBB3020842.1 excisionase family DNA binding protein [Microvirga lupini]
MVKAYGAAQGSEDSLTTSQAAKYLGMSASYLAKARMDGTGPRFMKIGRSVRYRATDLDDFLRSCTRSSTSQG